MKKLLNSSDGKKNEKKMKKLLKLFYEHYVNYLISFYEIKKNIELK